MSKLDYNFNRIIINLDELSYTQDGTLYIYNIAMDKSELERIFNDARSGVIPIFILTKTESGRPNVFVEFPQRITNNYGKVSISVLHESYSVEITERTV